MNYKLTIPQITGSQTFFGCLWNFIRIYGFSRNMDRRLTQCPAAGCDRPVGPAYPGHSDGFEPRTLEISDRDYPNK